MRRKKWTKGDHDEDEDEDDDDDDDDGDDDDDDDDDDDQVGSVVFLLNYHLSGWGAWLQGPWLAQVLLKYLDPKNYK